MTDEEAPAVKKPARKVVKVRLAYAKETPGTYQYKAEDPDAAIKTLYLPKNTVKALGKGAEDEIVVSLASA
ncbi:MAG: hypothetical protein ACREQA_19620 [Candidatus Binatia bacterium]